MSDPLDVLSPEQRRLYNITASYCVAEQDAPVAGCCWACDSAAELLRLAMKLAEAEREVAKCDATDCVLRSEMRMAINSNNYASFTPELEVGSFTLVVRDKDSLQIMEMMERALRQRNEMREILHAIGDLFVTDGPAIPQDQFPEIIEELLRDRERLRQELRGARGEK